MTEQSLAGGAAGIALLHLEAGNWPAAYQALRLAVAGGVSIGNGASLFFGAPALAFILTASDRPDIAPARSITAAGTVTVTRRRLEAAHRRIDQQKKPHYAEYDLIRGLTGLGVALRRLGLEEMLCQVLTYLVRLTDPIGSLPGWWCWNGPRLDREPPPGGHANHGMAHGITGPLALLALTLRDGITVDRHTEAITRICHWLDTWQQDTDAATWWPETLTLSDLHHGTPSQQQPSRPSWCYGTPGIARAQQIAAQALHDTDRQYAAEAAFIRCVNNPAQLRKLSDRSLCHGTAGILTAGRRMAAESLIPVPLASLMWLHQRTSPANSEPAGFLDGAAGADLANAAAASTSWDACLLLS